VTHPTPGSQDPDWRVQVLETGTALPADESVSAVFLLALSGDSILAVRNERGWDIPGGHVELGETPASALSREVLEEAAATFAWANSLAVISVPEGTQVMLFYTTTAFELSTFKATADAFDRALLPIETLLNLYEGPADVLELLIRSTRHQLTT